MSRKSMALKGRQRLRVTTSAASYEQVAEWLRGRILAGDFDRPDVPFPSGPKAALETGTSQHTVQQAFGALAREGLIQPVQRRGMVVLPRRSWAVEFRVAGSADLKAGLEAAKHHPAITSASAQRDGEMWHIGLVVLSSGAGRAADTAEQVLALSVPVLSVSARDPESA